VTRSDQMVAERYLRFIEKKPNRGQALLYPVHVWKVIYPKNNTIRLNLFQQAILGLVRARCYDLQEIADYLKIDHELVAFIIAAQLIPNGWMTSEGRLTPAGEKILDNTEELSTEVQVGYAYQDAISGNWLPRFTDELSEIESQRQDKQGYPAFLINRETGKEERPHRLKDLKPAHQDINQLFSAYKHYRTDYARSKQLNDDNDLLERLHIESISCLEKPQLMWLWTWIFPDVSATQPWLISDPFGLTPAVSWLRKPLEEILPSNKALAGLICKLIDSEPTENLSHSEYIVAMNNKVEWDLIADFPWLSPVPEIQESLAMVLRRMTWLEGHDGNQEDWNSLHQEGSNLAERFFQWILKTYPTDTSRFPQRNKDYQWTVEKNEQILLQLQLPCVDDALIRKLKNQKMSEIRSAFDKRDRSLKAMLIATLFSTIEHAQHPFKHLANIPFNKLIEMTDLRNKTTAHAGKEKISKEQAMSYANFIVNWIKIFKGWYK
jgi:hypothetical protein